MLKRFGWARSRDARKTKNFARRSRHLHLESLEPRAMMTVNVSLNGATPVWYEGQDLAISEVTAFKDSTDVTTGDMDVKYSYTFTDTLTSNSFLVNVGAGFSPNQTIPWASFVAIGVNNGTYPFVEVTVT